MLKNKIVALLSVASMMFSFVTVANAEKTPIIVDPTFAVKYNKQNADGTHSYYFGISYTFEGEDPVTFEEVVLNPDEVEDGEDEVLGYCGIGFETVNIILEEVPGVTDKITKVSGTSSNFTQDNLTITYTATKTADTFVLKSRGDNIYTKFTVTTSEEIDVSAFKCASLTVGLVDYGTEASEAPIKGTTWRYSSDPVMVEGGAADFLAYTGAQSGDEGDDEGDDDQPTVDAGYKAVADIQGLTAEFAAKYAGQYFFTQKLDLAGKAATAHITISRGEEASKTIERDLATLLGIDAEAQPTITAGSIAVTVVTDAADVNPFTFVIE